MTRTPTFMGSVVSVVALTAAWLLADAESGVLQLTAAVVNVSGAPDNARFEILRWSTEAERDRLLAAWERRPAAEGATKGGKGGAKAAKGRGAAAAAPAAEVTPESALAAALQDAPTVGYLWTSEAAGYALRYAGRTTGTDGTQRIVLLTQRRLGAMNRRWNPAPAGEPTAAEFSVVELRLNAQGQGQGKASLTGKLAVDPAVGMVTLADYQALPVVFENVSARNGTAAKGKQ